MKKIAVIVFGIAAAAIFMISGAKETKAFGYGINPYHARIYSPVATYGNYYYSAPYYYYYSAPYYYGYPTYYPYNYWYSTYRPYYYGGAYRFHGHWPGHHRPYWRW